MRCNNIPRTHKPHAVRNEPGCACGDWQEVRDPIKENQCGCWYTMQQLTAERNRILPAELTTIPPSVLQVNRRCPLVWIPGSRCPLWRWCLDVPGRIRSGHCVTGCLVAPSSAANRSVALSHELYSWSHDPMSVPPRSFTSESLVIDAG